MIELRDVSRTYVTERRGHVTATDAVANVSLTIPTLQFVSVVGESGSGKTTMLRLIAGLTPPSAGQILVDGEPVTRPGPDRAVVFQHVGLYPWRTVEANVRLGLELSGAANGNGSKEIVERHLQLVGLSDFAHHYPNQLSGGMQQRVGLARALAVGPTNLLMDEPFGAVDAITRARLGVELLRIWEHEQRTVVFITHSLDEALLLSDRVVVMKGGAVVDDIPVDLPRPRDPDETIEEPAFRALRRHVSRLL
jgi:NitT/TauT family transport system ATP-binding protein